LVRISKYKTTAVDYQILLVMRQLLFAERKGSFISGGGITHFVRFPGRENWQDMEKKRR
jgi:hypothetical protein